MLKLFFTYFFPRLDPRNNHYCPMSLLETWGNHRRSSTSKSLRGSDTPLDDFSSAQIISSSFPYIKPQSLFWAVFGQVVCIVPPCVLQVYSIDFERVKSENKKGGPKKFWTALYSIFWTTYIIVFVKKARDYESVAPLLLNNTLRL